jgi:hypothetical protein
LTTTLYCGEVYRRNIFHVLWRVQQASLPVEFHNDKDSVMTAARILWVLTMRSREILHHAKGDHLDRVHSDQMVLEMIRRGRLVR